MKAIIEKIFGRRDSHYHYVQPVPNIFSKKLSNFDKQFVRCISPYKYFSRYLLAIFHAQTLAQVRYYAASSESGHVFNPLKRTVSSKGNCCRKFLQGIGEKFLQRFLFSSKSGFKAGLLLTRKGIAYLDAWKISHEKWSRKSHFSDRSTQLSRNVISKGALCRKYLDLFSQQNSLLFLCETAYLALGC